jgi:signal transduction histidine kinase
MIAERVRHGILLADGTHHVTFANICAQMDYGIDPECDSTCIEMLSRRFTLGAEEHWIKVVNGVTVPTMLTMFENVSQGYGKEPVTRWMRCTVTPLDDDPDKRVLVLISDVTKSLEVQDILIGVKRLVSHKIRTPINGLLGPLDLLRESGLSAEERASLLELAQESARRLADAVGGLEEFFYQSGGTRGDDSATVRDIVEMARQMGEEYALAGNEIVATAPESVPVVVGRARLFGIIAELYENSNKFHPAKRPFISMKITLTRGCLSIVHEDDGCHVPPAVLSHLHVPFYQAEETLTGEVSGNGLGLAQVSRIVAGAGGASRSPTARTGPVCVFRFCCRFPA